jgi:hypothetical protein
MQNPFVFKSNLKKDFTRQMFIFLSPSPLLSFCLVGWSSNTTQHPLPRHTADKHRGPQPQSNELTTVEGPLSWLLSFIGGVHIGAIALLDTKMFGYIARLSQRGGGGYFIRSNDFYLPSLRLWGGSAPCALNKNTVRIKPL